MASNTAVTTIVVLASLREQAESAAIAADPAGGAGTFVPGVPLRVAGNGSNTPVAYWCRWNMKPGQRSAFAAAMGGPMNVIKPGGAVQTNRDRWMFESSDPDGWTGDQVLAVLGYEPPVYET